jgi:hypothetical protein
MRAHGEIISSKTREREKDGEAMGRRGMTVGRARSRITPISDRYGPTPRETSEIELGWEGSRERRVVISRDGMV